MRFDFKQSLTSPYPRKPWSIHAKPGLVVDPIPFRKMKRVEPLYRWAKWLLFLQILLVPSVLLVFVVLMQFSSTLGVRQWLWGWFGPISSAVIWGTFIAMIVAQTTIEVIARRRLKRRLKLSNDQLCPSCGYNLQGRPRDATACPECDYEISRRECVRLWCKLLRSRF